MVAPKAHCPDRAGWQKLANRMNAPVYCPGWLPDPLVGKLGGQWNNINSVSPDRSYLESFVWQENGWRRGGRGAARQPARLPGAHLDPLLACRTGGVDSRNVPCFDQPTQSITENGIKTRLYTVNQDADQQPHQRRLARQRQPVHALRARRAPAHVLRRCALPPAGAEGARADQPRRLMS